MFRHAAHTVLIGLLLLSSQVGFSGPSKDDVHTELNLAADHWDKLLKAYVDPQTGHVDYVGFSTAGQKDLDALMTEFSKIDVRKVSDDAKRAFYINFYNAGMIANILRYAAAEKIDVKSSKFQDIKINKIDVPGGNIWNGDFKFKYLKHELTLDDIEHGLIRGQQKDKFKKLAVDVLDPRIHVAVNCAAASCPRIREVAYREANINQMLNENFRAVINSPTKFKKLSDSKAEVNSIFYWYYEDFDNFGKKVLKAKGAGTYLATFVNKEKGDGAWLVKHLEENFNDRGKIGLKLSSAFSFEYNWLINDQRNAAIKS
jgi:hypothetical protein